MNAIQSFIGLLWVRFLVAATDGATFIICPAVVFNLAPRQLIVTWQAYLMFGLACGVWVGAGITGFILEREQEEDPQGTTENWRYAFSSLAIAQTPLIIAMLMLTLFSEVDNIAVAARDGHVFVSSGSGLSLSGSKSSKSRPGTDAEQSGLLSSRTPVRRSVNPADVTEAQVLTVLRSTFCMLTLGASFWTGIVKGFITFVFAYLETYFELSPATADLTISILLLFATTLGILQGGYVTDYHRSALKRQWAEGPLLDARVLAMMSRILLGYFCLSFVLLLLAFAFNSVNAFFLFFSLGVLSLTGAAPVIATLVLLAVPLNCHGAAMAVINVTNNIGQTVLPLTFALALDALDDQWRLAYFLFTFLLLFSIAFEARALVYQDAQIEQLELAASAPGGFGGLGRGDSLAGPSHVEISDLSSNHNLKASSGLGYHSGLTTGELDLSASVTPEKI